MHPGITRMIKTIRQHFTWPKLDNDVEKICISCRTCQLTKKTKKKYGHLPPKEAEAIPWDTLCIDLIGPYTVKEHGKKKWLLHCLTMIDGSRLSKSPASAQTISLIAWRKRG